MHHSIELFHQPTLIHNFLYSLTIYLLHYYPRCCVNTIFTPEDGHVNARNMSRIITNILLMNKENCALQLVDEIILFFRC